MLLLFILHHNLDTWPIPLKKEILSFSDSNREMVCTH